MSSRACVTWPSLTTISMPPSPSTRARAGTLIPRLPRVIRLPCVMGLSFLPDGLGGAEREERPARRGAEASVAAAAGRRAQRAAAGLGHRPEARRAVRHEHAGPPGALALDAHAVRADVRPAAGQQRRDHFE